MLKVQATNLGRVVVLKLQGQIVRGEAENLRQAVQSQTQASAVILDLARVTAVDAGGLGLMLHLRQQFEVKGIRFELMNVNRWVRKVLAVTRLDSVFEITSSVELFPSVAHRQTTPPILATCA